MENLTAKVVEDSLSKHGRRLTTMQLHYPRFIHSEFMTHRVFSRNASSSRAIPVAKIIDKVRTEPAEPTHWGQNQSGMQANVELDESNKKKARELWLQAAENAAKITQELQEIGLHKQVANRLLEPFSHISVIVTATEWKNFFDLRAHEDAQPEIHTLAVLMQEAMDGSKPKTIIDDATVTEGWHLPYITENERAASNDPQLLAKMSASRCARVSYLTHDGATPSQEKDLQLYDRLVGSEPIHASPVEHQATPLKDPNQWSRNFRGWLQFRDQVEQDVVAASQPEEQRESTASV